jgi:excisionase family DNA binding protein
MMNNTALEPLLLSPSEVGRLLGISRSKVFELIASGQLPPSYKLGRSRKFKRTDIEQWIDWGMPSLDKYIQLAGGNV